MRIGRRHVDNQRERRRRSRDRAQAQEPDRQGLCSRNGIIGALTEDLIDTSKETAASLVALTRTPGGAFARAATS
jgi:hypothetical protein